MDALKARIAPGPVPAKGTTALRVVTQRTLPADAPKLKRARVSASAGHNCPKGVAKKKFRWRRPRHTLRTQTASEVDRIGLRLQLRKRQAKPATSFFLMSEALNASLSRERGRSLRRPARASARTSQESGAAGLARSCHAPTHRPYQPNKAQQRLRGASAAARPSSRPHALVHSARPVVLVEDNGPIHVSKLARAALAARAHGHGSEPGRQNTRRELNDIGRSDDLKAHHLADQTFTDSAALGRSHPCSRYKP